VSSTGSWDSWKTRDRPGNRARCTAPGPAAGCDGSATPLTGGVGNRNRNTGRRCCWCSGRCNRCRPLVGRTRPTARCRSAGN